MTVITVKKTKRHIELCADSQVSQGYMKYDNKEKNIKDFSKIFSVNDMIIAHTGLVYEQLFLKEFCKTNKPKGSRLDDIESFFLKFYEDRKNKDSKFTPKSSYIIVYEKRVFSINQYMIYEVQEWDAKGCGREIATAILHIGRSAKKAAEVAAELIHGVGGKIVTKEILL